VAEGAWKIGSVRGWEQECDYIYSI
jgi:hypothetical protein